MEYLLNAPFILDFAVTLILFGLCFVAVVGIKVIIFSVKEYLPKRTKQAPENAQPIKKQKTIRRKPVKSVRSIEINPDEIDRIYVKKIS
ncbi:MAG: hypothetical protein IJX16_05325 [Clostridia bacterium]|nr:hypothetical protein [Clostridia bacterium]